jgi:hypothetical protein
MLKTPSLALNIIALNVVWFAAVLGAASGLYWLGPVSLILSLYLQFKGDLKNPLLLKFFMIVGLIGFLADSAMILTGAISFECCALLPQNYPLWMLSLWVSFATALFSSLAWIRTKLTLGSILGCIGGVSAYYGGYKLGPISLATDTQNALLIIGMIWAIAMPLLSLVHLKLFPK